MNKPIEESLDEKYIDQLSQYIQRYVTQYKATNPMASKYYWADYLYTGYRKPSYDEIVAIRDNLKKKFTNMKISAEKVYFKVKVSGNLVPRWNRLTFSW